MLEVNEAKRLYQDLKLIFDNPINSGKWNNPPIPIYENAYRFLGKLDV